jgi:hypothetical protein
MKRKVIFFLLFLAISLPGFGQLVGINSTSKLLTNYTNINPNDTIYVYCKKDLNGHAALATLKAMPLTGTAPFTFDWQKYDAGNHTYTSFWNDSGATSMKDSLSSGGYNVIYKDTNGNSQCALRCWVFIDSLVINVDSIPPRLDSINLNAQVYSAGSFTYYDPIASSFLLDSTATISVCFDALHSYVSDLGFHLVGPPNCGSPDINFWTPPGLICNSGDNVNGLCFSTSNANPFNSCVPAAPHTLSGSYASTMPWNPIYGCSTSDAGWAVQIYDCVAGDVGTLTHASIVFTNNSACGPNSYVYDSGPINSAINDHSCTPQLASIFTFGPQNIIYHTIQNPISYNWIAHPQINIPNSQSPAALITNPLPNQSTWFILTASDSLSGCSAVDSSKYWYSTGVEINNREYISLNQNSPNPFSEKTVIGYSVPLTAKDAQLIIYDNRGTAVKTHILSQKGKGQITVFGNNLESGLYTYKLVVDGKASRTRKMVCVK